MEGRRSAASARRWGTLPAGSPPGRPSVRERGHRRQGAGVDMVAAVEQAATMKAPRGDIGAFVARASSLRTAIQRNASGEGPAMTVGPLGCEPRWDGGCPPVSFMYLRMEGPKPLRAECHATDEAGLPVGKCWLKPWWASRIPQGGPRHPYCITARGRRQAHERPAYVPSFVWVGDAARAGMQLSVMRWP